MLRNNISDFNINPLLSELDNVIRKHMNIMLNEYIDRFNLLEQTHKQIMNLPSVVDELRRYTGMSRNSGCEKSCQPSIVLSCVNENIHFEMKEEENSNSSEMCSDDIEADIESGAEEEEEEEEEEDVTALCKNQDCSPIKDAKFTEKCSICSGYFADDGLNDVYFLNENGGVGSCNLCKKTENICIMKGTGQYVCVNACDEEEEEEEEPSAAQKTRIPIVEEEEEEGRGRGRGSKGGEKGGG